MYFTALSIGHCTTRLCDPQCDLDPAWCVEPLEAQASRCVALMHQETVVPPGQKKTSQKRTWLAPVFAYCFPLLRRYIDRFGAREDKEAVVLKIMAIVTAHAQRRRDANDSALEVCGYV